MVKFVFADEKGVKKTIKQDMIIGKLRELPAAELRLVEGKLREILAL